MTVCPNLVQNGKDTVFADGNVGNAADDELPIGAPDLPAVAVTLLPCCLAVAHAEKQLSVGRLGFRFSGFRRVCAYTANHEGAAQAVGAN